MNKFSSLSDFDGKRRRRRSYRGLVNIPGLDAIPNPLKFTASGTDVVIGVGEGLAGIAAFKMIKNKALTKADGSSYIPDALQPFVPLIGALVAAGVDYFLVGKKSQKARGRVVGALAAGAAVTAIDFLRTNSSTQEYFADVVALRYNGYGMLVNERTPQYGPGGYSGMIVDEPGRALSDANLADLASASMGDDEDGMDALMTG